MGLLWPGKSPKNAFQYFRLESSSKRARPSPSVPAVIEQQQRRKQQQNHRRIIKINNIGEETDLDDTATRENSGENVVTGEGTTGIPIPIVEMEEDGAKAKKEIGMPRAGAEVGAMVETKSFGGMPETEIDGGGPDGAVIIGDRAAADPFQEEVRETSQRNGANRTGSDMVMEGG